jgi:ribosomal-protein-alanine N-acetyltransferase
MPERLPYRVEPMTLADVDQVMNIERVAFSAPRSARAYRYEISENDHSTMLVVRLAAARNGPFKRLACHVLARHPKLTRPHRILGYAGFWLLVDEAHICTIAVHPQWQGRGLGELLMLSLLNRGMELGASKATLEVRVSNQAALALYRKYGFEVISRRKRYYSNNNEDAYIMTTPLFEVPEFQENLDRCRNQLFDRLQAQDPDISTRLESSAVPIQSPQAEPARKRRAS